MLSALTSINVFEPRSWRDIVSAGYAAGMPPIAAQFWEFAQANNYQNDHGQICLMMIDINAKPVRILSKDNRLIATL